MPESSPSSFFMEKLRLGGYDSAAEAHADYLKYFRSLHRLDQADAVGIIARMRSDEKLSVRAGLIDLVPKGWFRDYLKLTPASESPISFHFLCALALFSHKIGRKAWTSFYGGDVFAPESAFLVSPAGLARRSDAISAMCRVAESAKASLLKDQPTPEALITYLSERPHTLIVATEAASILNSSEYMQQIPQFLCQLLDCESSIGLVRQSHTTSVVNAACNTILSAAPVWFEGMPSVALGGGLLSRVILIFEHDKERSVPFPGDVIPMDELRAEQMRLGREILSAIRNFHGMLEFSGQLKQRYITYYEHCHVSQKNSGTKMSHWYGRKAAHFQKMLMSFLCAQGKGLTVDAETFDAAEAVLELLERKMDFGYRHASQDRHEKQRQVILDHLDRLTDGMWVDRTSLFQRTSWIWKNAKDFDEVLDTLGSDGLREIESRIEKTPGRRSKRMYRRIRRS